MKHLIALFATLLSLSSYAASVEVISAEYQVENERQEKTLCLTVVRVPESGEILGIVEDIYDCFYAREARRNPENLLDINPRYLREVHPNLLQHLQSQGEPLRFYFSDGE